MKCRNVRKVDAPTSELPPGLSSVQEQVKEKFEMATESGKPSWSNIARGSRAAVSDMTRSFLGSPVPVSTPSGTSSASITSDRLDVMSTCPPSAYLPAMTEGWHHAGDPWKHLKHQRVSDVGSTLSTASEKTFETATSYLADEVRKQRESNSSVSGTGMNQIDLMKIIRGEDRRTTFMIRNIPNKYTQQMLLDLINETHRGQYDFVYLRMDFKNRCNVGYAFINFISPLSAVSFALKVCKYLIYICMETYWISVYCY
jgi:hypothetical protein